MLPLHKDAQGAQKDQNSHAGLWYDRFFNGFLEGAKKPDEKNKKEKEAWAANKTGWIENAAKQVVGDKALIERYCAQHKSLCQALKAQTLVMSSDWHFVTGLGNNHPVENGFAWHHTLGVPYLTGAAVKGMVRAWCEVWEGMDDESMIQWFGPTMEDIKKKRAEKACVGELIFFDAVPTAPVKLKADIMTPHYGDWYAKGSEKPARDGSNVPADWHDPTPIPFLVVDKGASFQFAVAKRAGSDIELDKVIEALQNALEWIGAGAKTAAGYGKMSVDIDSLPANEKMMAKVRDLDNKKIALMLGKNKNKSMKEYGNDWESFCKLVKEVHGEKISNWQTSPNKNEKKVWKLLYGSKIS